MDNIVQTGSLVVYSRLLSGHRRSYVDIVSRLFPDTRVVDRLGLVRCAFGKAPLLFLMIEEDFLLYVGLGMLRRLLGRRTVGLLFRLRESIELRKPVHRIKNALLRLTRMTGATATLPILPVSVLPGLETVASGWIYDFQFWDLPFSPTSGSIDNSFASAIRSNAAGRKIVVALGRQDASKGFTLFARTFCASPALRNGLFFVAAGKIAPECMAAINDLRAAGATVLDREISDAELLALYELADVVWCLYDPTYDQASGIFGRSLQLGRMPLLRVGSLIQHFCTAEGIDFIAADYEADAVVSTLLHHAARQHGQACVVQSHTWRDRTISVLESALFGEVLPAKQRDIALRDGRRQEFF